MTIRETLTNMVLVGVLAFGGVACKNENSNSNTQTISGIPLSAYSNDSDCLATVLDVNGTKVLSYTYSGNLSMRHVLNTKGVALIQSEINDGDNEPIRLTGQYEGNHFKISSIEANGYKIDYSN